MMSRLSVGSATYASPTRLRSNLEEAPTLDSPAASADGTPTWLGAPSWYAAENVFPDHLERPGDIRSPMPPAPSLEPPPGRVCARKTPASLSLVVVKPPLVSEKCT